MQVSSTSAQWWGSLLWLVAVAVIAFGVAWLSGTRLHIRKGAYIPLLLAVTGGLSAGYLAWAGVGFNDVVTTRWEWGLLGGLVAAGLLAVPAARQPVDRPVHGRRRTVALAWEGIVYGAAEGVLLSALPPFIVWQMVHSLGWSGVLGGLARWVLPMMGGALVIVIHHLGYWDYRNKSLVKITPGLTVLSAAFLVTGSWIAPTLAHIALHSEFIVRGSEMPPHERTKPDTTIGADALRVAA